jgi:hypothetical protein
LAVVGWRLITDKSEVATWLERDVLHNIVLLKHLASGCSGIAQGGQLERLAAPFTADANDGLYQWESSRDYNPSPGLEGIQAAVLAINSADDERKPPETVMERELKRVKNTRLFLIPEETRGHATTYFAKFWKEQVKELLQSAPRR